MESIIQTPVGISQKSVIFHLASFDILKSSSNSIFFPYSCLVAAVTSQGLGAGFSKGTPASRSLSRLALPMSQAAVPRFLPQTNPTAANTSMNNLLGLNWDEMPNSDAAFKW
jgi:hypothetical protein